MKDSRRLSAILMALCLAVCAFITVPVSRAGETLSDEQLSAMSAEELTALRKRIDRQLRRIGAYDFVRLSEGSRGDEVEALQERLQELGYYLKAVDGKYQQTTAKAMRDFQKAAGLERDGNASVADQKALFADTAPVAPTPTPGPTAKPTRTPKPTATPRVTRVPTPTKTPKPTRTPSLSKDYPKFEFRLAGLMPEKYKGNRYKVSGTVLAQLDERWLIRSDDGSERLIAVRGLETEAGRTVQIWGLYEGLTEYAGVSGPVTLPLLTCEHVE